MTRPLSSNLWRRVVVLAQPVSGLTFDNFLNLPDRSADRCQM